MSGNADDAYRFALVDSVSAAVVEALQRFTTALNEVTAALGAWQTSLPSADTGQPVVTDG